MSRAWEQILAMSNHTAGARDAHNCLQEELRALENDGSKEDHEKRSNELQEKCDELVVFYALKHDADAYAMQPSSCSLCYAGITVATSGLPHTIDKLQVTT